MLSAILKVSDAIQVIGCTSHIDMACFQECEPNLRPLFLEMMPGCNESTKGVQPEYMSVLPSYSSKKYSKTEIWKRSSRVWTIADCANFSTDPDQ